MKVKLEIEIPDEVAEWSGWPVKGRRGRQAMRDFFRCTITKDKEDLIASYEGEMVLPISNAATQKRLDSLAVAAAKFIDEET